MITLLVVGTVTLEIRRNVGVLDGAEVVLESREGLMRAGVIETD